MLFLVLGTAPMAYAGVVGDAEEVLESLPSDRNGGQAPVVPSKADSRFPASHSSTTSTTRNAQPSTSSSRPDSGSTSGGRSGGSLQAGGGDVGLQPDPVVLRRRTVQRQSDNLWSFMGLLLLLALIAAATFFGRNVERDD